MTDVKFSKNYLDARGSWCSSAGARVAMIFLVIFFSVGYLLATSSVSTKGYDINDLQKKIKNLEQENQKVELQIASYRSMESIQQRISGLNLVKVDDVSYMNLPGKSVARR